MLPALVLACADPGPAPFDDASVTAVVSDEVVTVATVTWGETDADGLRVEFGPTTGYGRVATPRDGAATLFLREQETWHFRLVAEQGGLTYYGADHEVRAGELPNAVPELTLVEDGEPPAPYVLTSWMDSPSAGTAVTVLDGEGHVSWYHLPTWGIVASAKVAADGGGVVYNVSSHAEMERAELVRVAWDGTVEERVAVPYAHHDLLEVPHGRWATLQAELRDIDGEPIVGDRILEIDADGVETVVWSAFDSFEVEENLGFTVLRYPFGADWTHANSIFYDEASDSYTVSLFMVRCVVNVARTTGEVRWRVCQDDGSVDDPFGPQHAAEPIDGGLQLFDNGYDTDRSRLVRYALADGVATRTWEWAHPEGHNVAVLGDIDSLPDGRTLSSWGEWREIVVTDDDEIAWRVTTDDRALVTQVEAFDGP